MYIYSFLIARSYENSGFHFLSRFCLTVFHNGYTSLPISVHKSSNFCTSWLMLVIFWFLIISHLNKYGAYLIVILMISNVAHLFMFLLAALIDVCEYVCVCVYIYK